MDKKAEADCIDRKIRTFPEFTLGYINRLYGLKKIALQNLKAILKGLELLYNAGNLYGIMICRLLQIFHERPIPHLLSIYLTQARIEFNKLPKDLSNGHQRASLADVFNLVYNSFISESRWMILQRLKPIAISKEAYFLYVVTHKMLRNGLNAEQLYMSFDVNSQGFLSEDDLIKGFKKLL